MVGFLGVGFPSGGVIGEACTASEQAQATSGRKGFYVVCSRLESYHGCLSVISTADLACVFHNASLVNVLQEPSKNSRSVAPLTSSNQHLEQTDFAEQPQTDRSCEDGPLRLPRAVLLLPWQLLPVVGYGFCVLQPERSPPGLDCGLMQRPFPEFCLGFVHTIRELH